MGPGIDAHSEALLDAVCARLGDPPSPEVRESIGFFLDHLVASVTLGAPYALTEQLQWQTRRLRVLAPELDTERLALVTRAVIEERMGGAAGVEQLALAAVDHLELARGDLALRSGAEPSDPGFGDLARHYLELALAEDHDEAVDLVLASELTPYEVLLHVLEPAQVELGRRWEQGDLSVAQEHGTTALTERVMALLRGRRRSIALDDGTVYAGVVGEDLHRVGLEMVSELLELAGWRVVRAPGVVDRATVVEQVARVRPDVLALSVTLLPDVVALRAVIEALRSDERSRHIPVVVGGRPFLRLPSLADLVGADDWARDGAGAVEACRRQRDLARRASKSADS